MPSIFDSDGLRFLADADPSVVAGLIELAAFWREHTPHGRASRWAPDEPSMFECVCACGQSIRRQVPVSVVTQGLVEMSVQQLPAERRNDLVVVAESTTVH
jgi:hypothetical protein